MKYESVGQFLEEVAQRNPGQPEFLQAVTEVMVSLWPFIEKNPKYAVEKALQLGAKVVSVSDSSGTVYDQDGFTTEKLAILMDVKNHRYGRVDEYATLGGAEFLRG
jgi:hypothetical protein